jgi:hypothetical protein
MDKSKDERDEKLVELAKVQGDFEAQVLKGMLESEGIEVAEGERREKKRRRARRSRRSRESRRSG